MIATPTITSITWKLNKSGSLLLLFYASEFKIYFINGFFYDSKIENFSSQLRNSGHVTSHNANGHVSARWIFFKLQPFRNVTRRRRCVSTQDKNNILTANLSTSARGCVIENCNTVVSRGASGVITLCQLAMGKRHSLNKSTMLNSWTFSCRSSIICLRWHLLTEGNMRWLYLCTRRCRCVYLVQYANDTGTWLHSFQSIHNSKWSLKGANFNRSEAPLSLSQWTPSSHVK